MNENEFKDSEFTEGLYLSWFPNKLLPKISKD